MIDNWNHPPPRKGILGALDRFIGPGATRPEAGLQVVLPIIAAIAAPLHARNVAADWSAVQYIICAGLAFDIAGGIVTNSTSAGKRWYHRQGQTIWKHLSFASLHLLHLMIVSWIYLGWNVSWLVISGGVLILLATAILAVPHYLQRPVAAAAYTSAFLVSIYVLESPQGLEWFLPLFFLKLLMCHLVKEEPYQPKVTG
ncbi:MAG: hypothetical protein RLY93_04020 [Sumerlaeia bacterium]